MYKKNALGNPPGAFSLTWGTETPEPFVGRGPRREVYLFSIIHYLLSII